MTRRMALSGNQKQGTYIGLGLVAEMNLVETRTCGGYIQGGGTRTGGESMMEVDMWYMAAVMTMVVYGSGDGDGGIWKR